VSPELWLFGHPCADSWFKAGERTWRTGRGKRSAESKSPAAVPGLKDLSVLDLSPLLPCCELVAGWCSARLARLGAACASFEPDDDDGFPAGPDGFQPLSV
jgi:hypothetical protein